MKWTIKSVIFAVLLALTTCDLMAQTYKLQTYSFSSRSKNSYGIWSDWSKWEASDMLVVINQDKDRITIYSQL